MLFLSNFIQDYEMDKGEDVKPEEQVSKVTKPPCYKIIILGESGVGKCVHNHITYMYVLALNCLKPMYQNIYINNIFFYRKDMPLL